jgi:hypothetical protein
MMLFRKSYAARRKNTKPLEKAVRAWNCQEHGTACGDHCQYARAWMKKHLADLRPGGGGYSLYTKKHTRPSKRRGGRPLSMDEAPEDYLSSEAEEDSTPED